MPDPRPAAGQNFVSELKVSGHLMTLDTGLFCLVHSATGAGSDGTLPGVRISLPPDAERRPGTVTISSFRPDGWLGGPSDAALVRVTQGPAQILVTIYRASEAQAAPQIQVLRLAEAAAAAPRPAPVAAPQMPASQMAAPQMAAPQPQPARPAMAGQPAAGGPGAVVPPGVVAHVQRVGDVHVPLGSRIGEAGSQRWIEGFGVVPPPGIAPEDIEYQAVLGRGWLSPWAQGGQFCGSRGMALPLLGLRVRLRGQVAETYECVLSATFTDGTRVGPVRDGAPCEAETLSPLESFQVTLQPRMAAQARPEAPAPAVRAAPASRADAAKAARAGRQAARPAEPVRGRGKAQPAKPAPAGRGRR